MFVLPAAPPRLFKVIAQSGTDNRSPQLNPVSICSYLRRYRNVRTRAYQISSSKHFLIRDISDRLIRSESIASNTEKTRTTEMLLG